MVHNFSYNTSKTAKIDSNITNIREIYSVLRYECTIFIVLLFRSIIKINIRIGGNKKLRFSIFFSICQITTSAGP